MNLYLPTVDQVRAEAAATRRLARFYRAEADLCGCAHLSRASRLCFLRARQLELEAKGKAA